MTHNLSICIPVFNVDIVDLTHKLIAQAKEYDIEVEINIIDDGSAKSYKEHNSKVSTLNQTKYVELPQNMGCAAIRNQLATTAKYDNILFLDSDSGIAEDYLLKYKPFLNTDDLIVCGGRIHPQTLPGSEFSLRWKVGKLKEDFDAEHRSKEPNKSFMSNNFLTKRKLFEILKFDEEIPRSGHEDTVFGIELEEKNISITHINNPVVHIGLEENDHFLRKTKQRIETLVFILNKYGNKPLINNRITILRYFFIVQQLKLTKIIAILFKKTVLRLEKHLMKNNPSMLIYDLYKIGYLASLKK